MPAMLQRYIGCDKWLLLYSSPFSCRGLSLFLVLIQTSKHNAIPSTTVRMRLSFSNQCSGVFLIALLVNTVTASATFTSFTAHATGVKSQFPGLLHIHATLSTHTPLNWVRTKRRKRDAVTYKDYNGKKDSQNGTYSSDTADWAHHMDL